MPNFNTDYLKFDAQTIKDGIVQNLTNNSDFTDQLFEGSNLMTMIDMTSYMFQVLTYYANHGSSEAMFTDAQLYENMNRIVKMLGYSPGGYSNPETSVSFSTATSAGIFGDPLATAILPKYTAITTGLTDSNGEEIYYSFAQNLVIENTYPDSDENTITSINGRWNVYERTFISAGQPLESYTLELLGTVDDERPTYVSHPYVDVYIRRTVEGNTEFIPFQAVFTGTLFGTENLLFGPNDRFFELRLNEDKQYEIRFGDGIHGQKIQENDEIYVIYLKGNGEDGQIGADILNVSSNKQIGIAGLDRPTLLAILGLEEGDILSDGELAELIITNIAASSESADVETVASIRQNAPNFFRMGGRLVTARDYRDFIISTFRNTVHDVHVMNNWEYLATFHNWLYELNLLTVEIREQGYIYADSCDFNNVYIWTKFKGDFAGNIENIERNLLPRKVLTSEPIIQSALDVTFVPAAINNGYDIDNWDPDIENWIEILKDKNSLIPSEKIRENALQILTNFFDSNKLYVGQTIDLNDLHNQLRNIEGVKKVSTVYREGGFDSGNATTSADGIRMAYWTKALVNGADLSLVSGNIDLLDFQFAVLKTDDISSRVKIVFESFGQPSVEY
jgi:hypothetical protein